MLKDLCELNGVSGDEQLVRDFIKSRVGDRAAEMIEDDYGNLIVRTGRPASPRIMVAAHMDEVGIMITGIEKNGTLKFKTIGLSPQVVVGKRVSIGRNSVPGVIGNKPIHACSAEETKTVREVKNLYVDIGAASQEAASEAVAIGDLGTFITVFRSQGDTIWGKAFDNRLGCYIAMRCIRETSLPLYYAFTVQEEAGLRGARTAAYRIAPDIGLAIDTTSSGEWPSEKDVPDYPKIGKGPALTVADLSLICDRRIVARIMETARDENIPFQMKKPMIGGTDAGPMHLSRQGVPAAVIAIPARYIHSPLAIASKKDVEAGFELLSRSIDRLLSGAGGRIKKKKKRRGGVIS